MGRIRRTTCVVLGLACLPPLAFRLSARCVPIRAADLAHTPGRLVRFTDRHGEALGSVLTDGDGACQPVKLSEVSPNVVRAFVAAEDRRFYRHGGVDWLAMGRAAVQNVLARRVASGGSTLTMQLARSLQPNARTLRSKLREMHTAWRLEAGMSKGEILEAYLNRVPMGGNLVGVGVASRVFFGQSPGALNLAQAALLAGIPQDPVRNDPRVGRQRAEARRAYVLRRVVQAGYATPKAADLARKSRVEVSSGGDELAAYQFFFHVLKALPAEATEIRLTLDRDTQQMVAEQMRVVLGGLTDRNVTNGAAVVLDNHTGEVLAYVGSASFFDVKHAGQVDGVQAARQPGSSLKPFVYALALEHGFTPATVLPDVPTAYPMAPGQEYAPENYSNTFHGPVLLRMALANSFNVPACHVASRLGVQEVLGQLHRFGYRSLDRSADYYGLGVVLGGGEVKLYEQARAYMALANGGELREPVETLEVNGKSAGAARPRTRVCEPVTSYLLTDVLSDHNARILSFGPRSALNLPFPCAAKTGTSSGHRDNWTLGYARDYTVAVWVGNFDGSEMEGVSGITGAGPLFARIMYHLYRNRPEPEPWRRPPGVARRPVCSLSGYRPGPYCPHTRDELLPESALPEYDAPQCTWHSEAGVEVPKEFRPGAQP